MSHRCRPDVRTTLYRVAQEALNNVADTQPAGKVTIILDQQPGRVDLSIQDDGRGFDAQRVTADHLGLGIMRERVAAIGDVIPQASSAPGTGTCIREQWQG